MKRYIKSNYATNTTSDFTVIQEIYRDGMEYMEEINSQPAYTQEYGVNLDEVMTKFPEQMKIALKDITDETFKSGELISDTLLAKCVSRVIGEDTMYGDFNDYVHQHKELPDPVRHIEVRINNPKCLPSAEEYRSQQGKALGKYIGRKLGLSRY